MYEPGVERQTIQARVEVEDENLYIWHSIANNSTSSHDAFFFSLVPNTLSPTGSRFAGRSDVSAPAGDKNKTKQAANSSARCVECLVFMSLDGNDSSRQHKLHVGLRAELRRQMRKSGESTSKMRRASVRKRGQPRE